MKKVFIFLALVLIVLPFRLYHISFPLVDATNFRQAQTATVVLNFYKHGINLMKTELDIFGISRDKYLTLEFPLYEAFVTILYKLFFVGELWGRLVSVFAGLIGAYYLFKVTNFLFRNLYISVLSTFFYLTVPLSMLYQRDYMMDPLVITFLLAGFYYFLHWVDYADKKSYILSLVLLLLGFVQKGAYGPFWLLPLTIYLIQKKSMKALFSFSYLSLIILPLVGLFLWQQHVNSINILNNHPYFTTQNKGFLEWNFGVLSDRFNKSLWDVRFRQINNGLFLKPGLLIFFLGLIFALKIDKKRFLYWWLLSQVMYFLILFRIQSHNYYQLIIIPLSSIFMAIGLYMLAGWLSLIFHKKVKIHNSKKIIKAFIIASFCGMYLWRSWLHARWDYVVDWDWYHRITTVGKVVPADSVGIFVTPGYDWNSVYTYYTKKKMMVVGAEDVTETNIAKWRNLGYSFMVLHDYNQYPDYLAKVKPHYSLDFLSQYPNLLTFSDFQVFLLAKGNN